MKWEISFMNCFVGKNFCHFTKLAIKLSKAERLLTNILVSEKLKLQNSILGMVWCQFWSQTKVRTKAKHQVHQKYLHHYWCKYPSIYVSQIFILVWMGLILLNISMYLKCNESTERCSLANTKSVWIWCIE